MTDFSSLRLVLPAVDISNLDITNLLAMNLDNLEETLQHQPTLYCTFGLLAREAERQVASLKEKIEEFESTTRRDLSAMARLDSRRLVKDEIKQECYAMPAYIELKRRLIELEHAAAVLTTIEEAFRERFGMVQQIAKRRSNELSQLGQAP